MMILVAKYLYLLAFFSHWFDVASLRYLPPILVYGRSATFSPIRAFQLPYVRTVLLWCSRCMLVVLRPPRVFFLLDGTFDRLVKYVLPGTRVCAPRYAVGSHALLSPIRRFFFLVLATAPPHPPPWGDFGEPSRPSYIRCCGVQ